MLISMTSLFMLHEAVSAETSCEIIGDDAVPVAYSEVPDKGFLMIPEGARPAHCLVSVAEAHRQVAQHKAMLIDIRLAEDFGRISIPGSVSMPGYALRTKVYLRDKSIILVEDGHSYGGQERLCDALRQSGYRDVRILEGGLRAWQDSAGKLTGDDEDVQALSMMRPLDFARERQYSHWHVLQLSDRTSDEQTGTWGNGVKARLAVERQRQSRDKSPDFVLVVTPGGESYPEIERLRQQAGLRNLFYLEGGMTGIDAYFNQQFALLHRREGKRGKKSPCDYL